MSIGGPITAIRVRVGYYKIAKGSSNLKFFILLIIFLTFCLSNKYLLSLSLSFSPLFISLASNVKKCECTLFNNLSRNEKEAHLSLFLCKKTFRKIFNFAGKGRKKLSKDVVFW